jgi:hypothetical protein
MEYSEIAHESLALAESAVALVLLACDHFHRVENTRGLTQSAALVCLNSRHFHSASRRRGANAREDINPRQPAICVMRLKATRFYYSKQTLYTRGKRSFASAICVALLGSA